MPKSDPLRSEFGEVPSTLAELPSLQTLAAGAVGFGVDADPDPRFWSEAVVRSTQDTAAMMVADAMTVGRGVPFAAGQHGAALQLITDRVPSQAIRAVVQSGPASAALGDLQSFARQRLGPALQTAIGGPLETVVGAAASVAGLAVPVVGAIVSGWVKMFAEARKWRRPVADPLNELEPEQLQKTDRLQALMVRDFAARGEFSRLFRPPGHPKAPGSWPEWTHGYGDLDFETDGRLYGVGQIGWTGYGTGQLGGLVAAGLSFGGHPAKVGDGWRVTMHRGVMCGTSLASNAHDAGQMLPQTSAALAQAWALLANPASPNIWTIHAASLHDQWVEYLAGLRRVFHLTTVRGGGTVVPGIPAGHVLTLFKDERTGSSQSSPKVRDTLPRVRQQAVDAMADVLGWPKWSAKDDADLAAGGRPLPDYVARYNLRACHAPRAFRWLYGQQRAAARTASVAYCATDQAWDDAVRDDALRKLVKDAQAALRSSRALRYVDLDMVPAANTGWRQSVTGRADATQAERAAARPADLLVGGSASSSPKPAKTSAASLSVGPLTVRPAPSSAATDNGATAAIPSPRRAVAGGTVDADGGDGAAAPVAVGVGGLLLLLALLL
mgnify:CR=1 FL=1